MTVSQKRETDSIEATFEIVLCVESGFHWEIWRLVCKEKKKIGWKKSGFFRDFFGSYA